MENMKEVVDTMSLEGMGESLAEAEVSGVALEQAAAHLDIEKKNLQK